MGGSREQDAGESRPVVDSRSTVDRLAAFRAAFWKFLRPHTIRGTILGATAVTARALLENQQARAPTLAYTLCINWHARSGKQLLRMLAAAYGWVCQQAFGSQFLWTWSNAC